MERHHMTSHQINRREMIGLIAAGFLTSILGCRQRAKTKISNMHVIDYAHIRDGVLYHGTVSDLDKSPKSTWTYEQGGRKVTRDQTINQQTFQLLCDGIKDYKVFQKHLVRDSKTRIDPTSFHIVTFIFAEAGQERTHVFLIPAGETDAEFTKWLNALNVP
jgi:hypothetical protein